ncbi:hypothetical protein AHF37_12258 [Paragonimus kellicotti]|nr:hypothetical protein AHF37_12258 [Paragonimus kellicotti]
MPTARDPQVWSPRDRIEEQRRISRVNAQPFVLLGPIPCTYDSSKVRYLFLTGKQPGPQSAYVDEILQREFDCYGDIVQYNSLDDYRLLPKKQFIALSLVHHLCSHFPFVFMTDEDFLINIPKLTDYLLQVPSESRRSFVGGHLYKNMHPTRDKGSKYYVQYYVYPNKTYPPFVAGGASLMSTSLIPSEFLQK